MFKSLKISNPAPRILLAALVGAMIATALYQLPWRGAVNIGDPWDSWFLGHAGVYDAESGGGIDFRWTGSDASITMPGLTGAGPLTLSLWVAGRPGSIAQTLSVQANGHALPDIPLPQSPMQVDLTIPRDWLPTGNLQLDLHTDKAAPEGETRELGALLDRVAVSSGQPGLAWPDPLGVLAAAMLGVLAALLAGRTGLVLALLGGAVVTFGIVLARPWYGLHSSSLAMLLVTAVLCVLLMRRKPSAVRIGRNLAPLIGLALFAFYALLLPGHFYVIDDDEKFGVTESLVLRGGLRLDPPIDGRVYSKYGVGHSIASAPLLVVGLAVEALRNAGPLPDLRKAAVSLLDPICTAATAALLYSFALQLWASRRRALLIALTYGLATLAFPHALFAFSEPLIGLLLLAGLYCLCKAGGPNPNPFPAGEGAIKLASESKQHYTNTQRRNFPPAPVGKGLGVRATTLALSGALFGFLILTKLEFALVVPLALIYYLYKRGTTPLRERIREIMAFSVPFAAFLLLLVGLNVLRFGSPLSSGYDGEPFSTPIWEGLYGLLLSSGKSIFLYSPPLLLVFAGRRRFWGQHRAEAVLVTVLGVGMLIFYSCWWAWSGDWTWGPRFTLPLVPLLLLALGGIDFSSWYARIAAGVVLLLGLLAQAPGVLADWRPNFLRFATFEEAATRMSALWFDPNWSPLLLNARRMAIGPELGAAQHLSDFGLPHWASLWTSHLLFLLLLVSLTMLLRGLRSVEQDREAAHNEIGHVERVRR